MLPYHTLAAAFSLTGALAVLPPAHGQTEEDQASRLQRMVEASKLRAAENKCKILRQQNKPCSFNGSESVSQDFIPFDVEITAENLDWKSTMPKRLPYSKIIKMNHSDQSSEYFVIDNDTLSTNYRDAGYVNPYNPWGAFFVNLFSATSDRISLETKWTADQVEGRFIGKQGCSVFTDCPANVSYPFPSPLEIDADGKKFKLYGEDGKFVLPLALVQAISSKDVSYLTVNFKYQNQELSRANSEKISLEIDPKTLDSLQILYPYLLQSMESPRFDLAVLHIPETNTFQELVSNALQSVVMIESRGNLGTGFIAGSQNYIFTNRHVVGSFKKVDVTYFDGVKLEGDVVFRGYDSDFAMIKVNRSQEIPPLPLCYNVYPNPAEDVVILGNPLGLANTVSRGIVSAVRSSPGGDRISNIPEGVTLIQTDASVNPGNSGGPMINSQGEVIGIVTYRHSFGEGLGFAMSIIDVLESLDVQKPTQSADTAMTPCGNIVSEEKPLTSEQLSTSLNQ